MLVVLVAGPDSGLVWIVPLLMKAQHPSGPLNPIRKTLWALVVGGWRAAGRRRECKRNEDGRAFLKGGQLLV